MEVQTLVITLIVCYIMFKVVDWWRRLPTIDGIPSRCVLITGCDSGFGNELARRLDKKGFFVIATCLTEKGAENLKSVTSERLRTMIMDVSKSESIKECFEEVKNSMPCGSGLWGLVNNAGINDSFGRYEWRSRSDFQKCLDVNLLGLMEVTTTFLPLIKRSQGRIVNVSSMNGRISTPGGAYPISKYGIEAFSDGLRQAMYAYKVNVSIIEPGMFKTNISRIDVISNHLDVLWNRLSQEEKDEYGEEWFAKVKDAAGQMLELGSDKTYLVVDAMEHALTSVRPRIRYVVGWDAKLLWLPLSLLPAEITDLIMVKLGTPKPKCCEHL